MKHLRKLASVVLALVMALCMTVTAFAATVENKTNHSYEAYQIFSATQATDGGALGDIAWGDGINSTAFLDALKKDGRFKVGEANVFANCTSAKAVAEVLAANTGLADAFADVAVENINGEGTTIPANGENADLTKGYYLLVDVTTPGVDDAYNAALLQVVEDGNLTIAKKYDAPEVDKTVNDSDANIGDTVTFTLTATMPERLDGYDTYKVIFHDTLSAGLDFVEDTVKVTIDGNEKTDDFTAKENGGNLTISCEDVLTLGAKFSSKIVVTYDAVLDDDAVIGTAGNPNKVYLEYSNNPNDEGTGSTTEKKVEVFTWEIPVYKYTGSEENKTPLAGAGFTLYKGDAVVNLVAGSDDTSGIYKVCTQTGCTDHEHLKDGEIITDAFGKFEIEGLEQGTYLLKETLTPAGYNTCADVTVVIGANGVLTQNGEATNEVGILNNAGAVLPETGGIGTTIFYVVGGGLVLAAVVLLVVKRRMNSVE